MKRIINTITSGFIGFWVPLLVLFFLLEKMFTLIHKIVVPIESHLPEKKILGVSLIFILVILIMLILSFFGGILLKRPIVKNMSKNVETKLLQLIPGYNSFKTALDDQNALQTNESWHAVLVEDEIGYLLGYTTDESDNYYSVHKVNSTTLADSELSIVPKSKVHVLNISAKDFMQYVKRTRNTAELVEQFINPKN